MIELPGGVTSEHIHQSNLIENINDPEADTDSRLAWTWLVDQDVLNPLTIQILHWLITLNQLPSEYAGRFREVNVMVGRYHCPNWRLVPERMGEWLHAMNREPSQDPKEMHVRFEKIHPFIDGNGRTGRMLMWRHQMMLDVTPTLLRADEKDRYYQWFK
jgi:Fic family protein